MNNFIPYNPKLREFARFLRNNSTFPEILLWKEIKNKSLGVEFKRQVVFNGFQGICVVQPYANQRKVV